MRKREEVYRGGRSAQVDQIGWQMGYVLSSGAAWHQSGP